jgi:hypothetical protein
VGDIDTKKKEKKKKDKKKREKELCLSIHPLLNHPLPHLKFVHPSQPKKNGRPRNGSTQRPRKIDEPNPFWSRFPS